VRAACTWGRCTFCADSKFCHHTATSGGNVGSVIQQVAKLAEWYEAEGIYFLDAELPEHFMVNLAEALRSLRTSTPRWGGNARFATQLAEPSTAAALFAGGCRLLRLGLESGSPHILKRMAKGITPRLASKVLAALHHVGIATHVYLMKGFPGETETDWQTTRTFLFDNAPHIDMFSVSSFQLYSNSSLALTLCGNVEITADANHWTYPVLRGYSRDLDADAYLFREMEREFFTHKPVTRCFSSMADTLLLSDRFILSFGETPVI
jgi:hypothetical protein